MTENRESIPRSVWLIEFPRWFAAFENESRQISSRCRINERPAIAQSTHFDELANLPFKENRLTKETAQTLCDQLLFQRATQTYLWALPGPILSECGAEIRMFLGERRSLLLLPPS
jgi:hypothetical protein